MRTIVYKPHGICAFEIMIDIDDDDTVQAVRFAGGCDGNHKGLDALCRGMKADEVVKRLEGIKCGYKSTSCPDQLAKALKTR
ncbi:MAG: TIGR03905 family TSCPD domain-containing protein [Sphaerochaetaceae bacterium]|nr:TIGR03905 family TSCPD domain-containing protein [Sphaerochaetaceae bacterium]MDD3163570.1 TIGR03905 family TSCPD domain-containing protein [Sphaerochaetaceae bacterium]MDD4006601.1 TIGR03905 family TSCPD domain-containing protein [Sphaerochaetaceae bacterium]MDD4396656.1 TIGR03905 family TSCPD domain-containing protein [Sphaerochaetaceae bacterium]